MPAGPISARSVDRDSILPADCRSRIVWIQELTEMLRLELGKPKASPFLIQMSMVSPREVYFQSLLLYRNADRLAFEINRSKKVEPQITQGMHIVPFDVFLNLNRTWSRLWSVKTSLEIPEIMGDEPSSPLGTTPTEVFQNILMTSRQLNLLLNEQVKPKSVFQQVDLAVLYTKSMIGSLEDQANIPYPKYVRAKQPKDVLLCLHECFEILSQIYGTTGETLMMLTLNDHSDLKIVPSDVYSFALMVVSELDHLHSLRSNELILPSLIPTEEIFPSHVFQHATYLKLLLGSLQQQISQNPQHFQRKP